LLMLFLMSFLHLKLLPVIPAFLFSVIPAKAGIQDLISPPCPGRGRGEFHKVVILSPSLFVILNEVKDLEGLRINFAKDLAFISFYGPHHLDYALFPTTLLVIYSKL